jgi:hypothetical protein
MATVTANKMSSLISKGKLPAIEVARLIHNYHVEGFSGRAPTGFTEVELKKLASNLNNREWVGVSHWVEEGIDLLYGFAMNIKSDAALVAVELHQFYDSRANIRRVLWHYEALRIIGDYMNADWTFVASKGMEAMYDAIEETEAPIDLESLNPSEEVIDGWRQKVGTVDIRDFLLAVVECEVVD